MENSERFDSLVAKTAKENGSVFFVDSGEGRELETETMSGEGLFGWLMQIRPTAFTISLIIYSFIALFLVYTEFGIDSPTESPVLVHADFSEYTAVCSIRISAPDSFGAPQESDTDRVCRRPVLSRNRNYAVHNRPWFD